MLAGMRSYFLLSFLLALVLAVSGSVAAQVNGVPPSVTSIGFGGSQNLAPGVRPSVTSLGANGFGNTHPDFWNCCANLFMPANPNAPLFFEHRHHHKDGDKDKDRDKNNDHADLAFGVIEPVYIPYPVPYAPEPDDDSVEADNAPASGPRNPDLPVKRTGNRDAASQAGASANPIPGKAAPVQPVVPVVTQPSTVLVFKDGHMSTVVNYAIVNDTLFDFGDGFTRKVPLADLDLPATQKVNDSRGVDFQVPSRTAR
jgi:hypothetical protein